MPTSPIEANMDKESIVLDPNFKITEVPDTGFPLKIIDTAPCEKPDFSTSPLPDWLSTNPSVSEQHSDNPTQRLRLFPRTKEHLELEEHTFQMFFERFLDAVTLGDDLRTTIASDPRGIDPGRFMRWIKKNSEYQSRFEEAQEIATELILSKMDAIAEGTDNLEDIERSKLRLKQYEFKVKAWNKKRYGDTKQVDINMTQSINIRALIEERDQQLLTLEGEYNVLPAEVAQLG